MFERIQFWYSSDVNESSPRASTGESRAPAHTKKNEFHQQLVPGLQIWIRVKSHGSIDLLLLNGRSISVTSLQGGLNGVNRLILNRYHGWGVDKLKLPLAVSQSLLMG